MAEASDPAEEEEHIGERMSTRAGPSRERGPERGGFTKWAAVALIVVLLVGALVYLCPACFGAPQGPGITFSFPTVKATTTSTTKTTTSTGPPPGSVAVKSAIFHNDGLYMDVVNTGTIWTRNLTVASICAPGFKSCYSYKTLTGHSLTKPFALAPKAEYVYELVGICVVPVASCTSFHPVVNFSYYYKMSFGYVNGASATLPVTVRANNTAPIQTSSVPVLALTYQLDTFPRIGDGRLTVVISMNSWIDSANFTGSIYTIAKTGGFTQRILDKTTGCGGNLPADCSSGNLTMIMAFSTVRTGVSTPNHPLPYLLTVTDLTGRRNVYFAVWVTTLNAEMPPKG